MYDDTVSPLRVLASGSAAIVRALPDVGASIDGLDQKRRERLIFIMRKACDFGPDKLPPEQFKAEERMSTGDRSGTKVQVFAFKVHQYRVYACQRQHLGKRTLICTAVDESKKRDKADRALLKRAAENFARYAN